MIRWHHGGVDQSPRRTADAAAQTGIDAARAAVDEPGPGKGAGSADPLIGDLRRAGVLPLLVLHYAAREPSYGNQLMDRIAELTDGALVVNPNTMYPLLHALEARGLLEGRWEHPERRSRRFYAITPAGEAERARLAAELGPRLDRIARSIATLRSEVLG